MQRVVRSTVIDAPIDRVWAVLRDFNSHDQWHTVVAQSRIEANERSDRVGCIRNFSLQDGNHIREQLLSLDDHQYKSTYCIVEASVPLLRYVATVTLKPVTDSNQTFWHWESSFATPPGRESELSQMVARDVYEAGFQNLRRHLAAGADLQTRRRVGVNLGSSSTDAPWAAPLPSRQMVQDRYGDADVMRVQIGEAPAPRPGQVRIAQRAIGVNFFDIYLRRGWIPDFLPLPGTLGMEAVGAVIDVGEGVTDLLPGDRVAYLGPLPGAYCSVRTVPSEWVVRLPPTIEDRTAAAVLLKGCTADFLLRDLGHVRSGQRLLVHAAAGGVGSLVCAWANHLGATVIGTVSSEAKARVARAHGCQHVIVTTDYRFADDVQRLGGAQLIIDGLGAAAFDENLKALARGGHWVSLGQASGALPAISPDLLVTKSATFSRPVVFDYVASRSTLIERAERVWQALADGALPPPSIELFSLDAAALAHQRLESRASTGALVLVT